MLVEVCDQAGLLEDPALPRLRCAGNLTSPRARYQGLRVEPHELGRGFELEGHLVRETINRDVTHANSLSCL
jgi:hypothetical protein